MRCRSFSEHLKNQFVKWLRDTSSLKNEIPKSVVLNKESLITVDLHAFGEVSIVLNANADMISKVIEGFDWNKVFLE